jgi:hypothetical protein
VNGTHLAPLVLAHAVAVLHQHKACTVDIDRDRRSFNNKIGGGGGGEDGCFDHPEIVAGNQTSQAIDGTLYPPWGRLKKGTARCGVSRLELCN